MLYGFDQLLPPSIFSFHMSSFGQAAAALGGLFVFQILVYMFVSFSNVST